MNSSKQYHYITINIQGRLTSAPIRPVLRLLTAESSISTKTNFLSSCHTRIFLKKQAHTTASVMERKQDFQDFALTETKLKNNQNTSKNK